MTKELKKEAEEYCLKLEKEGFDCFSCFNCKFAQEETSPFKKGYKTGIPFYEFEKQVAQAYIAGAKKNGLQWHKVADGEYPRQECGLASIDVLNDRQELCYFHSDYGWCDLNANEIDPPIAWCEIPQFKGE